MRDRDGGGILVYCHAGCSQEAVIGAFEALGVNLHPPPDTYAIERDDVKRRAFSNREANTSSDANWRPILPVPDTAPEFTPPRGAQFWTYLDAKGKVLMHVTRRHLDDGRKMILPWAYATDQTGRAVWRSMELPVPRHLYGLDQLAAWPDAPVLVTEGEKAADAAMARFVDYVAGASPGGSKAADRADGSPLKGRDVVIWPDNDAPGQRYANDVARLATTAGATSLRIVAPPTRCAAAWDLADPLSEAVSDSDLNKAIASAAVWEASEMTKAP